MEQETWLANGHKKGYQVSGPDIRRKPDVQTDIGHKRSHIGKTSVVWCRQMDIKNQYIHHNCACMGSWTTTIFAAITIAVTSTGATAIVFFGSLSVYWFFTTRGRLNIFVRSRRWRGKLFCRSATITSTGVWPTRRRGTEQHKGKNSVQQTFHTKKILKAMNIIHTSLLYRCIIFYYKCLIINTDN